MSKGVGWIRIYRSVWGMPISSKPSYLSVWLWILCHAQYKSGATIRFEESEVTLKAGQLVCGAIQISTATGVPRSTVQRILRTFVREQQIEMKVGRKGTLITVSNWSRFQEDRGLEQDRGEVYEPQSEQQTGPFKEIKKRNNINCFIGPTQKTYPQGRLRDGTRVIRVKGQWQLHGRAGVKPHPHYYPEVAKDNVILEDEWRDGKRYSEDDH